MQIGRRCAGILLCAALLCVGSAASAAARTKLPVYLGPPSAAYMQVRPFTIVWTGDGSGLFAGRGTARRARHFGRLHWTAWSAGHARGWGANWLDNCSPDCARGTFTPYNVNLNAFRARRLLGYDVFTRMTVTYTGRRPGFVHARSRTWTLRAMNGGFYWCYTGRC